MKIEILPSVVGRAGSDRQFCMAVVVNDEMAIDAGTLGMLWPMERQKQIQHVFLSHSHVDHLATLPLFLNNVYSPGPGCVTVYASPHTRDCLKENVFNDRLWPDFFRLSDEESPFLEIVTLQPEKPVDLPTMRIVPVSLEHLVPTLGFIVESPNASVAFVSDTSPTERIWELVNQTPNLQAVFLEASLPNSHAWLAEKAQHLCPELFDQELKKLDADVPVFAYHLHPAFFEEIANELLAITRKNVAVAEPGRMYLFG